MHLPLHELRHRPTSSAAPAPRRRRGLKHLAWIVPLVIFDIWFFGCRRGGGCAPRPPEEEPAAILEKEVPPETPPPWAGLVYPTDQKALLDAGALGVYQPTASGNPESAMYGSVRTGSRGRRLVPTFHEGLDIAALRRDAQGRPLDRVRTVADGVVAHVSRFGGNSNYGIYVVVRHDDPIGRVFTLYAHLLSLAPGIQPGSVVKAGDELGRMGNTSSSPIPMARGHLHFEIGLILNGQFGNWFRAKKLKPDHGVYHGWNLLGLNPLDFLRFQKERPEASFLDFVATVPSAFDILLAARRKPDFFDRYPALWSGEPPGGAVVLACSENGVPLRGRAATAAEREQLGKLKSRIVRVHDEVLGRNGSRLVTRRAGVWVLAEAGEQWREMLLYPAVP
ncbi:MAG: M23 family metallopeptidase [Kiritimatiellae bacterium]|nr:M23 family metallopeptidase [Kiritimatiellia bacterium]